MRVSTMVRAGALTAIALAVAACTDSPNAPRQAKRVPVSGLRLSNGKGRQNSDTNFHSASFTVDPTVGGTYSFGNHSVTFPAYSICDPATSGYDPSLWDMPCTPLTTPITITVNYTDQHGHAYADFQPSLRFNPSTTVTLTLKDTPALQDGGDYRILWYRPLDGVWVNESAYDSSEAESVDLVGNRVSRRIKHFSGYNIISGTYDNCDPILNPTWCLSTSLII